MKDLVKIFWKEQSFLGKAYVVVILGFVSLSVYIGLLFLVGDLEVKKSPEVIPSINKYECVYDKRAEEYYCPDPPENLPDEFPARP